jgi:hypothetical protein
LNEKVMPRMLPPNCRYFENVSTGGWVVAIEEPPSMRTVKINRRIYKYLSRLEQDGKLDTYGYKDVYKEGDYSKVHTFQLAFPYVVFIFYISSNFEIYSGSVFVRPQQMLGMSDYLCKMPMSNISSSQSVCFGDYISKRQRSLVAAVQHGIMVFWSAEFNADYMYNVEEYDNTPILGNIYEWEYMSKENPMFVFDANWIQHSRNFTQQVEKVKADTGYSSSREDNYNKMTKIFRMSSPTDKEVKPTKRSLKTKKLYYDITQSYVLSDDVVLHVGDTIKLKDGSFAFVDSFLGFADTGSARYIQLVLNENKYIHLSINRKSIKFLIENIQEQRNHSEITLESGVTIKQDDIIEMKQGDGKTIYRKVQYIRKSRSNENLYELNLSGNYYLSSAIGDAKIVDIKSPVVFGIELKKDQEYLIIKRGSISTRPLTVGSLYKFNNVDIDQYGRTPSLVAVFKNINSSNTTTLNLSQSYTTSPIILPDKIKRLPSTFRLGRKLYTTIDRNDNPKDNCCVAVDGRAVYDDNVVLLRNNRFYEFIKLLSKDKLSIVGADFDIEFEIGDNVIIANWEDPLDVLNIKTLTGFKVDEEKHTISFILADKFNKLSECVYIDKSGIYTGKVRKVTTEFGKVKVGTKVIAKEAGISCFPKKDVNIVVAIIIDGPYEPLVLCSNGCTLWYSDVLSKFTKISMKSKRWAKLEHSPLDISKIKIQPGDIINGRSIYKHALGFLVYGQSSTRYMRAIPLHSFSDRSDEYMIDKSFTNDAILDCIPTPRLTVKQQSDLGFVKAYPDFHGGICNPTDASPFELINLRGDK